MTTSPIDYKDQLVRKLNGEYLEGFKFAFEEDENQTVAALTNGNVTKIIAMEDSATNLPIRYVQVTDKIDNSDTTYKLEVVRNGSDLSLVSTDMATAEVINEITIPALGDHKAHNGHKFDTLEECLAEFDSSNHKAMLQMEANETCEDRFAHVDCCLTDGLCYSVLLIIKPTSLRCRFSLKLPDSLIFALFSR